MDGAQDAVVKFVQFEGALVINLEAELAAPFDKGAFGDAQFAGDADVGPALGAALDEFLLRCFCMNEPKIARLLQNLSGRAGRKCRFQARSGREGTLSGTDGHKKSAKRI